MRFRVARLRALTFARFSADPICSVRKKNIARVHTASSGDLSSAVDAKGADRGTVLKFLGGMVCCYVKYAGDRFCLIGLRVCVISDAVTVKFMTIVLSCC